jgi:hypothetical protein
MLEKFTEITQCKIFPQIFFRCKKNTLHNTVLCFSKTLQCKKNRCLHRLYTEGFFTPSLHLVYCVRCIAKNTPNTPLCNPWFFHVLMNLFLVHTRDCSAVYFFFTLTLTLTLRCTPKISKNYTCTIHCVK